MKKNYITGLLALALIVGGVGTVSAINVASASEVEQEKHNFKETVTRSVENITDGVIITLTTDDADTLTRLQSMTGLPPRGGDLLENTEQSVEILDNGVKITITSDDADVVEKLQNMPEKPPHGKRGHGPFMGEKVTRSAVNTDNGVVVTFSSDDADVVEKLQNFNWAGPTQ